MCVCAARQRQSVRPASPNDLPKRPMMSTLRQAFRSAARSSGTAASVRHVEPPRRCACAAIAHGAAQGRGHHFFFGFKAPRARGALTRLRARECALRLLLAPHGACCLLPPPLNLRVCLTWWRCWLRPSEAVLLPRPSGAGPSAGRRAVAVVAVPTSPLTIVTLALHRASPCHAAAQLPTSRWAATLTIPCGTRPAAGKGSRRQHRLRHAPQPSASPAEGSGAASARHGASDAQCTL